MASVRRFPPATNFFKTGKVKAEKSLLSLSRGWSFESKISIWRIFFGKKDWRLREGGGSRIIPKLLVGLFVTPSFLIRQGERTPPMLSYSSLSASSDNHRRDHALPPTDRQVSSCSTWYSPTAAAGNT